MKNNNYKIFKIVWAVLFLIGLIGFGYRVLYGLKSTGLGSRVTWGLWIAMDIYLIGLSAGAFLLSSLVFVFRVKLFEKIGIMALFTAIVTLTCALLSAWSDIGHMERFVNVYLSPNFHSLLTWIVWLYTGYFLLLITELVLALKIENPNITKDEKAKKEKTLQIVASLGIPLAIAFHGGFGALFGVISANPFWHGPMESIFFLVGAVASGAAFLTALLVLFWQQKDENYNSMFKILGKIVLVSILFDALLEWAEISTALWWTSAPEHAEGVKLLLFGNWWWVFWIVHILLGLLIPVYLLITKGNSDKHVGWATGLVAVTFFAVRLNIVIPALSFEKIKGSASTFIHARLSTEYFPSTSEFLVGLFIFSFGIGAYYLLNQYFKFTNPHTSK
jgi:Ni/Fe-hydrogenase subunit HybB-like protein